MVGENLCKGSGLSGLDVLGSLMVSKLRDSSVLLLKSDIGKERNVLWGLIEVLAPRFIPGF